MKISFFVTFFHGLAILLLLLFHTSSSKKETRRPVVVKTYVQNFEPPRRAKELSLAKPIAPPAPAAAPVEEEEPKEEPQLELKEEPTVSVEPEPQEVPKVTTRAAPKKAAAKKAPVKPKKPVTKKQSAQSSVKKELTKAKANPNQQKLISMMKESLNALNGAGSSQKGSSLQTQGLGKTLGKLASETLTFERNYEEELILYLESILSLPEKGEVKLKLTLNRDGSMQKIGILKATSDRNRNYVETKLALRSFPAFGKHFKNETAHTFTITLTSENSR